MRRRKLIVVSNRGPVTFSRGPDGGRTERRGGGGLVTALRPLVSRQDITWIAAAMTDEDRVVAAEAGGAFEETGRDGASYRLRLVTPEPDEFDRYYNVFANPTLWFIQHHLGDLVHWPSHGPGWHEAWASYQSVNAVFADAVLEELDDDPDAPVWFHDYHLYLAPRLVRRAKSDAALAQFVHIPWPDADQWTLLPEDMRAAIHDGLLANDVLGFHTRRWGDNFLASAEKIPGVAADREGGTVEYEGRRTLLTAHPISVDTAEFDELAMSRRVIEEEEELERDRPERIVLRVDRTDPSKNIVRGFRAFELFLERHPEWDGRVGMLALLDPSRQDIAEYAAYLEEIDATVRGVNSRFGRPDWQPITLEIRDDFPRSVAAYKIYDVLLVNAIFDGMNLIAKEAPLVNARDGVVVLSENAGAHSELAPWVLTVNPFDLVGQADALAAALELPAETRQARAEAIRAHVREHDLEHWLAEQLADLDRVSAPAAS
ncbi:MAG TPA: trehalose-6-phosphate synthase [Gaiellaceae bacterium]|nr:trehalose-6-phosphate synthase [Gaiellaceae bacterium]